MKVNLIINNLKRLYPEKSIFENKDSGGITREIICEVEPTSKHPNYSLAIAVIENSIPHYHKVIKEEYEVLKGELVMHLGNGKQILRTGDKITIGPNIVHWVEAKSAWIKCVSKPGWTIEDHFLS